MDLIFNCPECNQELAVDSAGAGSEINCPNCDEKIVIPAANSPQVRTGPSAGPPPASSHGAEAHVMNPIASSAAAKIEMHLKVPVRDKPSESLIEKPRPPLEVAARESDKRIRTKTIRHTDCIEVGHDRFDDFVTDFLNKIGEHNIVSITTINYTHLDIGTQKLMTEYGVFIVYKG